MKEKIAKNIRQIAIGGFGILMLILFCMPYVLTINGYQLIFFAGAAEGFLTFALAFFQFLTFVSIAVIFDVALFTVLRNLGVITINKKCKRLTLEKFGEIMLLVVAILTLIELLFMIIFTSQFGVTIGVGSIFNAVMAVGAYVVYKVLDHYEYLDGIPNKPKVKKEKPAEVNAEAEVTEEPVEEEPKEE